MDSLPTELSGKPQVGYSKIDLSSKKENWDLKPHFLNDYFSVISHSIFKLKVTSPLGKEKEYSTYLITSYVGFAESMYGE